MAGKTRERPARSGVRLRVQAPSSTNGQRVANVTLPLEIMATRAPTQSRPPSDFLAMVGLGSSTVSTHGSIRWHATARFHRQGTGVRSEFADDEPFGASRDHPRGDDLELLRCGRRRARR